MQHNPEVLTALKIVLANNYVLYLKTQNYHWNIEGANFFSLHNLLEEQYTDYAEAIDDLAERIRALGEYAPGSFAEFNELANVKGTPVRGKDLAMITDLAANNQLMIESLQKLQQISADNGDPVTEDMAIGRLQIHQKHQWMLKAIIQP